LRGSSGPDGQVGARPMPRRHQASVNRRLRASDCCVRLGDTTK